MAGAAAFLAGASSSEDESSEDESAFLATGFLGCGGAAFLEGASSESELSLSDSESSVPLATFAGVYIVQFDHLRTFEIHFFPRRTKIWRAERKV